VDYQTGETPEEVAIGDFNADGILDLATPNLSSDTVSVLLGNGAGGRGDGTFAPKVDYPTGFSPYSVKAADFNSDGILDLVVINKQSATVSVLIGNGAGGLGDGTFSTKVDYWVGFNPHTLVVEELNSDGILDLAVANWGSDSISVLLGNGTAGHGNGAFSAKVDYSTGVGPKGLVAGDFNSDGILDLAVVNEQPRSVSILFGHGTGGHGDGTFGAKIDFPVRDEYPSGLSTGDFNSDGILDLVVAYASDLPGSISTFIGNGSDGHGDGTFVPGATYTVGTYPDNITVQDLNSDGIQDLAMAVAGTNSVRILIGNGAAGHGDGTFGSYSAYATGQGPWSVSVGDFNSDGIFDLAVADSSMSAISILFGNGTCLAVP
jgi:hypothetical protein